MSTGLARASGQADELISAAVRGLIAQRRLRAPQVALVTGISRTAFYNRLNNAAPWEAAEVDRLARYFEVSRDSLYEGRAEYPQHPDVRSAVGATPGNFTAGARSSTDRASDYGSALGSFSPFRSPRRRSSDRHKRMHVVPLTLVEDGQAAS